MKRILMVLLGFTLSLALSAQMKEWYNEISEVEIDPNHVAGINTMEGYISTFISTYGVDEYHNVLNAIEKGTLDVFTDHLRDLGAKEFVKEADYIKDMLWGINKSKLYFVNNDKLFVITFDPKDGESLYLYRRDDKGWEIASNLIRKDDYQEGKFMIRFNSKTIRWNENDTLFTLENLNYGSVHKISSGSVFVTFNTEEWYPSGNSLNYNSILVFTPYNKETYKATTFEPADKSGKVVNNITSYDYNWIKKTWHKTIGPAKFPVLYGTRNTEYLETEGGFGLMIRYIDGTINNPIDAGTINFIVDTDGQVFYKIPGINSEKLYLLEK